MAAKKSTNISLVIFSATGLIAVGYFIWLFLAPSSTSTTVGKTIATEIEAGIVKSGGFQALREFVKLPIVAGSVGRTDPFAIPAPTTENGNVNAPGNILSNGNAQ